MTCINPHILLSYKSLPYDEQENIDNLIHYNPDVMIDCLINLEMNDIKKLRYIKVFKNLIDTRLFWSKKLKSDFKIDATYLEDPFEIYKEEYVAIKKGKITRRALSSVDWSKLKWPSDIEVNQSTVKTKN